MLRYYLAGICTKRWHGVLGIRADDSTWDVSVLSANHHAAIPSEIETLRSTHPGESEVVLNNRVLGGIAITRGLFVFSIDYDYG
jgi:urea transporter